MSYNRGWKEGWGKIMNRCIAEIAKVAGEPRCVPPSPTTTTITDDVDGNAVLPRYQVQQQQQQQYSTVITAASPPPPPPPPPLPPRPRYGHITTTSPTSLWPHHHRPLPDLTTAATSQSKHGGGITNPSASSDP